MKYIVLLVLLCGVAYWFWGRGDGAVAKHGVPKGAVTLQNCQPLLQRAHKDLTPEEVVLKSSVAFIRYEFTLYAETLADGKMREKFRTKTLSPGGQKTRDKAMRDNLHAYTITKSVVNDNHATVTLHEQIGNTVPVDYIYELELSERGWVIREMKSPSRPEDNIVVD